MRLVLDTNVLVSALSWPGNERRVLLACAGGAHQLVVSREILGELARVLRSKFRVPPEKAGAYLRWVEEGADVVTPARRVRAITADEADNRVLECALAGRADAIVTGDRHLLVLREFRGVPVLRSSEALDLL